MHTLGSFNAEQSDHYTKIFICRVWMIYRYTNEAAMSAIQAADHKRWANGERIWQIPASE